MAVVDLREEVRQVGESVVRREARQFECTAVDYAGAVGDGDVCVVGFDAQDILRLIAFVLAAFEDAEDLVDVVDGQIDDLDAGEFGSFEVVGVEVS